MSKDKVMTTDVSDARRKRRWYHLTPDRLLIGLLGAEVVLLLADRFGFFGLTPGSGWNVLLAVGVVGTALSLGLLWSGVRLLLRRRPTFGIRSLFLLTAVIAILCGWFQVAMRQASEQKEAIQRMRATGQTSDFFVIVDYGYSFYADASEVGDPRPPGPTWLHGMLGTDFLADVVCIRVIRPSSTDRSIDFGDEDMAWLSKLPDIEFLILTNTKVSDLDSLQGMNSLVWLDLDGTRVSDAGLEHLRALPKLTHLFLSDTAVSNVGLAHLTELGKLEALELAHTRVDDELLPDLKQVPMLRRLNLSGTRITDAGLVHLGTLGNLQSLFLYDTQTTSEGVAELQAALPDCAIGFDWGQATLPGR